MRQTALLPLPSLPRLPHLTPHLPPSFKGLGYFEEAKGGADKDGKAPPPKHKVLKIFRDMPERNHASLMLVYRRAAELFSKVEALIAKYRPWVAIGLHEGSLDDLVDACATEAADFEANFKVLKAKRKEVEKLPATEKVDCITVNLARTFPQLTPLLPLQVDCITVNLAPFKAAVDDQQQRLTDALLYGMRRLSDTKKAEVDDFIAASMETLSRRPQSVDEIGTAKKEWREIVQNKEGVKGTLKKLEELGRQMRGVSKHGIELGPIMSKWEELELTLDAFNERVEEQMSHLRGQMDGRVKELQLKVSKFAARWNELKPKKLEAADPEAMAAVIARVKEWEEEFGDLEVTTERIAQDCDHFSLPPPAFSGIDEVKADISAFVSSCGLYEEYATKLGELGGEDWISFRGRLYVFEDFVIEWLEKARASRDPHTCARHVTPTSALPRAPDTPRIPTSSGARGAGGRGRRLPQV